MFVAPAPSMVETLPGRMLRGRSASEPAFRNFGEKPA
jgi:hypothetical protein